MGDVKEAFERVKLDIFYLNENLLSLQEEILDLRNQLNSIQNKKEIKKEVLEPEKERIFSLNFKHYIPKKQDLKFISTNQTHKTHKTNTSTGNEGVQTNSTDIKTNTHLFKPLNDQNYPISTGNEGVKTDRQTYKQTDEKALKSSYNQNESFITNDFNSQRDLKGSQDETQEILDSLDSLKKELRLKFKRLTNQELLVFSAVYQLEEQFGYSDYKMLSKKLKLTESSIRDYVRRLLTKNIPLEKRKINNKEINLFISPNLKKILPLDSLLRLVNL